MLLRYQTVIVPMVVLWQLTIGELLICCRHLIRFTLICPLLLVSFNDGKRNIVGLARSQKTLCSSTLMLRQGCRTITYWIERGPTAIVTPLTGFIWDHGLSHGRVGVNIARYFGRWGCHPRWWLCFPRRSYFLILFTETLYRSSYNRWCCIMIISRWELCYSYLCNIVCLSWLLCHLRMLLGAIVRFLLGHFVQGNLVFLQLLACMTRWHIACFVFCLYLLVN